ncbi:MAG: FAD-dependent oxidoreductase [Firmicutes bacterium]|nr:FAD-dependent oxidoreductase [Bacillota bacterium]
MVKVGIIGGGWAGTAAAIAAAKLGAEVELAERTDMLLGTGLVGGIMRNNGRWTATEESIAMGGGDLFKLSDQVSRHREIEFPGHKHASLYDVSKIEPAIRRLLEEYGVKMHFVNRGKDVEMSGDTIKHVQLDDGSKMEADIYIEATGSAGGMANCTKYGNGCVMCVYRCPTFGSRVSISAKAGVKEKMGKKGDGSIGAMSGSCKLHKDSLAPDIVDRLDSTGVAIIPIPPELRKEGSLGIKACQQYALSEFAENIILLDTGHAKLMSPFYPLEVLRKIPGFEDARFEDPYSGGVGNSMRYLALSPRKNTMQVEGVANLFCGGEKAGLLVGHTEAIITGTIAGHNAVRQVMGKDLVEVPRDLAIGEAIAWVNEQMQTEEGMTKKYTFSGAVMFKHLQEKDMYITDRAEVARRVRQAGVEDIFAQKP